MRGQKPLFKLIVPAMLLMLAFPLLNLGKTSNPMPPEPKKAVAGEKEKHRKPAVKQSPAKVKAEANRSEKQAENEPVLTKADKELLAKLVHAEAKGEPFKGKVAVAEVVLNRVESEGFPDTVKEVIYQENQFQPVANGEINKPADVDAREAVDEALSNKKKITNALFFYNPEIATDQWIRTRPIISKIGNHAFTS
ncbi:cell wall hydrolase [Neobacillus notoginsengisoli]|nr:cell wall hydrolase [Neobacillus notoginsengisoli]